MNDGLGFRFGKMIHCLLTDFFMHKTCFSIILCQKYQTFSRIKETTLRQVYDFPDAVPV